MSKLLRRLALHRPELRAWATYDWANSAFVTIIMASIYPAFYAAVANAGEPEATATQRFGVTNGLALFAVAVLSPILGAIADHAPLKKKFLGAFMGLGVVCTALMAFVGEGQWELGAVLFGLAFIGATGSFVFYDALLPHIASDDEVDRVSTAGYAIGYVGGGLLLAAVLFALLEPELFGFSGKEGVTRASFIAVAIWWVVFSIPMFRRVPEPPVKLEEQRVRGLALVRRAFSGLLETFRELKKYRQATLFLFAFLIYNDGVGTIIKMAVIYGEEIGLEQTHMFAAILLVQFVGIPFTFLFGQFAGRIGAKASIFVGLALYGVVSVLGYFMTTALHFYLLALLVGMVQGGVQALSRSLFASMIPRAKSGEFFGLFAIFEKFAGIAGPLLFAAVSAAMDSSRGAILAVISFFIVGGGLLILVNVDEGRRAARAEGGASVPR